MSAIDLLFDVKPESERLHQLALGTLLTRTSLLCDLGIDQPLPADPDFDWEPHGGLFDLSIPLANGTTVWVELKVDSCVRPDQVARQRRHLEAEDRQSDHWLYLLLGVTRLTRPPDQLEGELREAWDATEPLRSGHVRVVGATELLGHLARPDCVHGRPLARARDVRDLASAYGDALRGLQTRWAGFEGRDPGAWSYWDYPGFFSVLRERLEDPGFGMAYENNRQGGFWGCSFGWDSASVEGLNNVYLQFENDQLCFKVQVLDEPKQSELRDLVSRKLLEAAEGSGLRVEKPARFGKGTYMTVARLSTSPLAGGLDWDRLVGRLREARDLVAKTCDLLVASSTAPPTCKKCGGPLEGEGLCPACFAAEA